MDFNNSMLRMLTLLLTCCVATAIDAKNAQPMDVHWSLYNFPPYLLVSKKLPGEGAAVEFIKKFVAETPEINHTFEETSFTRVIGLMRDGVFTCNPLLLRVPEREAFVEFSKPIIMALPHHIVIRKKDLERYSPHLTPEGKVNLDSLLSDDSFTTTIPRDRAYPSLVSDLLKENEGVKHINRRATDFRTPVSQLRAGWIDYVIAYPFEIQWYSVYTETFKGVELEYLSMQGMPEYALGHVGCTKGIKGQQVIERINEVIEQEGADPSWNRHQFYELDSQAREKHEALLMQYQPFGQLK
ncbi:hypothetical protein [Vibrio sp. HN007]|uniref:hypothetical protein n=1 Tax=Vibrio iocasae TaxID=3098914 RepID=UPI0035D4FC9F